MREELNIYLPNDNFVWISITCFYKCCAASKIRQLHEYVWVHVLVAGELDGGPETWYPREVLPTISSLFFDRFGDTLLVWLFCNNSWRRLGACDVVSRLDKRLLLIGRWLCRKILGTLLLNWIEFWILGKFKCIKIHRTYKCYNVYNNASYSQINFHFNFSLFS